MTDAHRDEIAKLESLYAMNPEGRVFTHLAEACRKAGELERARQILEDGLQRHPDYASAHVVLGRVLADCGEDGNAAAEFRRVLELDRHNLIALRSLGELASRNGRIDEAIHYYGELTVLDPTDPALQEELRSLSARQGQAERPAESADGAGQPPEVSFMDSSAAEATSDVDEVADDEQADTVELLIEGDLEAFAGGAEESGEEMDELIIDGVSEAFEAAGEGLELVGEAADEGDESPIDVGEFVTFEPEPVEGGWLPTGYESSAEIVEADFALDDESEESLDIDLVAGFESTGATGAGDETQSVPEESWAGVPDSGDLILDDETDGFTIGGEAIEAEIIEVTRHLDVEVDAAGSVHDEGVAAPGEASEDLSTVEEASAEAGDEAGPEGRWQAPGTIPADRQAERSGPPPDTGEWIPADRWEWVAALADTSGSVAEESADGEATEHGDADSGGSPGDNGWPAVGGEAAAAEFDPETSFADLNAEPVDSFEAGAAAVLEAFVRDGEAEAGADADTDAESEFELEVVSEFENDTAYEVTAAPAMSADAADVWLEEESTGTEDPVSLEPVATPGEWPAGGTWTTGADDDSGDQVITETLAEIYASQGLYDRAAAVYRRLVAENPSNERLVARLADLESATSWTEPAAAVETAEETEAFLSRVESAWTGGEGATGADDSPYAWSSDASVSDADPGARVGDYFAALLAWRPSQALPSMDLATAGTEESETVDAWFSSGEREVEAGDESGVGREGEEDLEMFRSWLKSLKK